ncbi:receptor L domain protein [Ancylostoma caninum]|uniref:Receptor L domain protein n=1 Tax=Ancylostoma caninum TaxID=29170 RepID=A0A368HC01_ANCCA|nr:receptor L domain protein [Ancylostoma caninum]
MACRMRLPIQSEFEEEFRKRPCVHFFGHLRFSEEANYIYDIVQKLERITGCITIINSNLVNANFSNLREIIHDENFCDVDYALRIIGNMKLKSVTFHPKFKVRLDKVFISVNPRLKQDRISPGGKKFYLGSLKGFCH